MNGNMQKHIAYQNRVNELAGHMYDALFTPFIDGDTGKFIASRGELKNRVEAQTPHSVFEAAGKGAKAIHMANVNALRNYHNFYGAMPSPELLASAMNGIQAIFDITANDGNGPGGVFESAGTLKDTSGILMRDKMIALVLPVLLLSITARITNQVIGDYNNAELFKIMNIAGSTFGDLTVGDVIDENFMGQYSSFDRRYAVASGDGTEVGGAASTTANYFQLDSATDLSKVHPFVKKSIVVYYEGRPVAYDNGEGQLVGSFTNDASAAVTVSGTVNYTTGTVNPVFSVAPENAKSIDIGFDVDIEKDPTLIPSVTQDMDSRTLRPHQRAINGETTLQSLWFMRREYNIDNVDRLLASLRNILAADMDRKVLNDLYYFANGETSWVRTVPSTQYFREHYETLKETLLAIDALLVDRTEGGNGLAGIVADTKSAVIFKSMRAPDFVPASSYQRIVQPHYVGRIFGMWDLYENPQAAVDYSSLCFAKGKNAAQSGYVTGSAVPPLTFKHPVMSALNYQQTLWALDFRDINPWEGWNFYHTLKMTAS